MLDYASGNGDKRATVGVMPQQLKNVLGKACISNTMQTSLNRLLSLKYCKFHLSFDYKIVTKILKAQSTVKTINAIEHAYSTKFLISYITGKHT